MQRSIVTERDRLFLNSFWEELFWQQETHLKRTSAYHLQIDGQIEVVNRRLETHIRCLAREHPRKMVRWLPWAEFWFNTNFNTSIGCYPFKIVYGRDPSTIIKVDLKYDNGDELKIMLVE